VPYNAEVWHRYYSKLRLRIRKRARERYYKNRERELARGAEYRRKNPSWERLREKKLWTIEYFGGKCAICGFKDWRALQFDHKYGDGTNDRRLVRQNALGYYDYIRKNSNKFDLLCANCNCIKRFEGKSIPKRSQACLSHPAIEVKGTSAVF